MTDSCEVAIVGSGFAGSLLARVLAVQGYDVVLIERGTHPRFALGESSTPLANLSLERIALRYGLEDCYQLATHGRWVARFPEIRRGLKRGFTFYRHHPNEPFANRGLESERLLVAASPDNLSSDTHWLRADVDHHFVREAVAARIDFRDQTRLTSVELLPECVRVAGHRGELPFVLRSEFLIDASGPNGFLARQLAIPSALERTETRSALVFGHFDGVKLMEESVAGLPAGPYPDDWAAVHHLIDEGWMYSLRFDRGPTSAGFLIRTGQVEALGRGLASDPGSLWRTLLERYPTIGAVFAEAKPLFPIGFQPLVQHRLAMATGERWALMPHAYAFIDPLFSTGIAWSLLAVERLAQAFENERSHRRRPSADILVRYGDLLSAEANRIDLLVAGAYEAMAYFDLFAAQAMLYFAAVSFAEVGHRLHPRADSAWQGLLGVGDEILDAVFRESRERLRALSNRGTTVVERSRYAAWMADAIAPRNVAGLADPARHNLYPLDLDLLVERHALLGLTRAQVADALPTLRGTPSHAVSP